MNKETNPKDAIGIKKVPMHCVSCKVLMEMGLGMMEGGRKYGSHNYRSMGVRASVYYDAAMRHIMAWWEGEDTDADSGLHHLAKALSCLSVLRDSMHMENWVDDRPIQLPDKLNIDGMNRKAAAIIEKYPECKEPFTHRDLGNRIKGVILDEFAGVPTPTPRKEPMEFDEDNESDLRNFLLCNTTVAYKDWPEDVRRFADSVNPKRFKWRCRNARWSGNTCSLKEDPGIIYRLKGI